MIDTSLEERAHILYLAPGEEADVELAEEASDGTPVADGPTPTWTTSDSSLVAITAMRGDGLKATLAAKGTHHGEADITITADKGSVVVGGKLKVVVRAPAPPDALAQMRVTTSVPRPVGGEA